MTADVTITVTLPAAAWYRLAGRAERAEQTVTERVLQLALADAFNDEPAVRGPELDSIGTLVLRDHDAGLTVALIVDHLGVSESDVRWRLRKLGLSPNPSTPATRALEQTMRHTKRTKGTSHAA